MEQKPKRKQRRPAPMPLADRADLMEALGGELVVFRDGTTRTRHPEFPTPELRANYIANLIVAGLYEREQTYKELASDWAVAKATVQQYANRAHRIVQERGDPAHVRARVQAKLSEWLDQADPKDRVQVAKLWLQSAGALSSQLHVTHSTTSEQLTDEQVAERAIAQLIQDENGRILMRRALAEWDARHTLPPAEILACKPRGWDPEADERWSEVEKAAEEAMKELKE